MIPLSFPFLFLVFGSLVVGTVRLHRPQKGNVTKKRNARVSR